MQGTWTLDDFEAAREDPELQSPKLQFMVDSEYKRLRGIPQLIDPSEGDPWQSELDDRRHPFTLASPFKICSIVDASGSIAL